MELILGFCIGTCELSRGKPDGGYSKPESEEDTAQDSNSVNVRFINCGVDFRRFDHLDGFVFMSSCSVAPILQRYGFQENLGFDELERSISVNRGNFQAVVSEISKINLIHDGPTLISAGECQSMTLPCKEQMQESDLPCV